MPSPWYNCHGWLGINKSMVYIPIYTCQPLWCHTHRMRSHTQNEVTYIECQTKSKCTLPCFHDFQHCILNKLDHKKQPWKVCTCCFLPKVKFGWITQTHRVDSKLLTHIWMSGLCVCVDACVYTHACACLIVLCSNPRWRSEHHSPCLLGHHPGSPSRHHCPSHHHPLWPLQPPSDWLRPGCLLTCPVQANCVSHNVSRQTMLTQTHNG